jgi:hypothetical protein
VEDLVEDLEGAAFPLTDDLLFLPFSIKGVSIAFRLEDALVLFSLFGSVFFFGLVVCLEVDILYIVFLYISSRIMFLWHELERISRAIRVYNLKEDNYGLQLHFIFLFMV